MLIHSSLLMFTMIQVLISNIQPTLCEDACVDMSPYCTRYATQCLTNSYVQGKCKKTCNHCKDVNRIDACVDMSPYCTRYAAQCPTNSYVQGKCKKTCNLCVNIAKSDACVDMSPNCATNANQCHTNSYVQERCKNTCNLCGNSIQRRLFKTNRAPTPKSAITSNPGTNDLSRMDVKAIHAPAPKPAITSQPRTTGLSRMDVLFNRLDLESEACRQQVVCNIYKQPDVYASYSDYLAMELTGELEDLQRFKVSDERILRFVRYRKAAREGEDHKDCLSLYPSCLINTNTRLTHKRSFKGFSKVKS